jgi:protein O-GlcNAc transferase
MNDVERAKVTFFKGIDFLDRQDFPNAEKLFVDTLGITPRSIPTLNNLAIAQYQQNKIRDASQTAKRALEIDPKNIEAYLMLSDCLQKQEKYEDALIACEQLIAIDPTIPEAHCTLGVLLGRLGKHLEAINSFDRALALQPQSVSAFLNRGKSLSNLKRYEDAIASYDRALVLKHDLAEAHLGRGNLFFDRGIYAEALPAFDKAILLKPDLAEAHLGRGNVFFESQRHGEAAAAYDEALKLKPNLAEAQLGRGNLFFALKRYDEAVGAYDKALSSKPHLANAHLGRGNAFFELKDYEKAVASYDKAIAIDAALAGAWLGRGNLLAELRHDDQAIAAYNQALTLKPDLAEAKVGRANVFFDLKRYDDACAEYNAALALAPNLLVAQSGRLLSKVYACDWINFDAECDRLVSTVLNGEAITNPFDLLGIMFSSRDLLTATQLWTAKNFPSSTSLDWQNYRYNHDRVRLAYLSADFTDHPVANLLAGVFEKHDRKRFETFAISFGPDDRSPMRKRLEGAFDHFIDVKSKSDAEITKLLQTLEIDIAVDLMGYTKGARTRVFANRGSPIQAGYLGFASTMGATFIDYLLADATIIPAAEQKNYAEKIVYLPSFMPSDDVSRVISDRSVGRVDFGLPEDAFVFCCFNNTYKLNPSVFRIWMTILKKIDRAVLWLSDTNTTAVANLKKGAVDAGVSSDRLVFAKRVPSSSEHLARHRLADLFLDTLPYNAHTTASDALWAGLPVLTCVGGTFAGRVAASLLNAIGVPELITQTQEEYEVRAIELASHLEMLAATRAKLAQNRLAVPLFKTDLYTRHLECAYMAMYERFRNGLPPDHIYVPH